MHFTETKLPGAFLIEIDCIEDERGYFGRTWCSQEFADHGLPQEIKQTSCAFNLKKGTLRGMHFSVLPCMEGKLVRCTAGKLLDVIVDLRPDSPAFLETFKVKLSANTGNALYVPPGFAHGYQTLVSNTVAFYMMTEEYKPEYGNGFRWNDPTFNIDWPEVIEVISDRDNSLPYFDISKVQGLVGLYKIY